MDRQHKTRIEAKKTSRQIDREMNTALYILRIIQCGMSICDLHYLSIGTVYDIITESKNDDYDYPLIATQEDIDNL